MQLDSRDDRRTAFLFELNPRGVRRDGVVEADGTVDYSPDPVWEGAVHQDGAGWSVEMRIPLSQLRYNRGADAWGVQFTRFIQRRGEEDVLSFVPKSERNGVNRFGRLIGLAGLPASRHAEVAPYVSGRGEYTTPESGDPFRDGSDYFTSAGTDVRLGVGGNLALDATIDPDFGQVEVDPAIVNLSALETFSPRNARSFSRAPASSPSRASTPGTRRGSRAYFNSRRVGRPPQRNLDDEVPAPKRANAPAASRIPVTSS